MQRGDEHLPLRRCLVFRRPPGVSQIERVKNTFVLSDAWTLRRLLRVASGTIKSTSSPSPQLAEFVMTGTRSQPPCCFCDGRQGKVLAAAPHCALVDNKHPPTRGQQCVSGDSIDFAISLDLLSPKRSTRRRPAEEFTIVSMPEAAVDKNHCSPF